MSDIQIPDSLTGPQQGQRRPLRQPAKGDEGGHFLSIIGFDGMVFMQTFNRCMSAQGKISQLWRGWYCHGHEGQIRARNECAYQFLKTPCSHHLLLDSDIMFEPEHVLSLRKHPEARDSIICGAYCKKTNRVQIVHNSLKDAPGPTKGGLLEVACAGTGFMQVPRSAYLRIQQAFPKRWYSCDYLIHADGSREKKFSYYFQDVFFDDNSGLWRDMTEDWAFCHLARKAGVKIYLDLGTAQTNRAVGHIGRAIYPLEVEVERLDLEHENHQLKARIAELEGKPAPAAPDTGIPV